MPKKAAPKRIACYCRVSSDSQKHDSQREEIKRWLMGHRIAPADVTWFEDVETGATTQRPALKQLQTAVFGGGVDTLVFWKLDRISRDMRDGINLLADWCEKGLRVVSVTEQIDLSGPVGRMVARVLFGVAEIQRTQIRERQAAGIAVAKQQGKYQGRKQGTTKASPKRARELREQGLKQHEIATALGVSTRVVRRYLQACPPPKRVARVEMYLYVENNNKFVRGRKQAREWIETFVLAPYLVRKSGADYTLHIPYKSDEELDGIIENMFAEAWSSADHRHCFIEGHARDLDDDERYWDGA